MDRRAEERAKIHQICLKFGFKWLFTEELQKYPLWDKGDKGAGEASWKHPQKGPLGSGAAAPKFTSVLISNHRGFVVNSCFLLLILAFKGTGEKKICLSIPVYDHSARKITRKKKNGIYLQVQWSQKCDSLQLNI